MKLVAIVFCLWALWRLYSYLKANPNALSKEAFSKSLFTLGILALLLMAVIAVAVAVLK